MTTNTNKKMKVAKQMYTVFTPYGNEVCKTPLLEVAIKVCDKKSEQIDGDCYIENLKGEMVYETYLTLVEM